jgi:hypothetical protein
MNKRYVLLDARAGATLADQVDIDDFTVLLTGSAEEVYEAANSEEYGPGNVPADLEGNILWEWLDGEWIRLLTK